VVQRVLPRLGLMDTGDDVFEDRQFFGYLGLMQLLGGMGRYRLGQHENGKKSRVNGDAQNGMLSRPAGTQRSTRLIRSGLVSRLSREEDAGGMSRARGAGRMIWIWL
jgi:hypothetical protein